MSTRNIARATAYHDALNALDLAAVERMFADQAEYHSPSIGALVGREAIMRSVRAYFAEYPDQVATDEKLEEIDDVRVRSHWHLKATARSTGEAYERRGREVITFAGNGLILRVEVEDG